MATLESMAWEETDKTLITEKHPQLIEDLSKAEASDLEETDDCISLIKKLCFLSLF
jgi:hypothetical protein